MRDTADAKQQICGLTGSLGEMFTVADRRRPSVARSGANLVGAAFRQPRAIPYSQFKTESMAPRNACTSSAVV